MNVRISTPNLKHIQIYKATEISVNGLHSDNGKVTLCTPNLSSFVTNDYMSTDYSLQNLSSLVIADISGTSVLKNEDAPPELELHAGHYIARTKAKLFHKPAECPYFDQVNSADVESCWNTKLSLPSMLHSLKSVKIIGAQGLVNELMLLELLLKNSAALERMVVESYALKQCRHPNSDLSMRRMKKFSDMLLKLPRAAATVSILFNNYILQGP
ncbi:hypothetical protein MKX03_014674 [Papaver bracteatum]|nr:hypothetical protein MKX03_014674 [Papaver bracteatum]